MSKDESKPPDRFQGKRPPAGLSAYLQTKDTEAEGAEASCGAFGYLRGIREQGAALELRFRNGNSMWFPYSLMGPWEYNPSEGLLLKFTGDVVYLVLIKGSNLNRPLKEGAINLTHAGLQRHRVLWIKEMSEDEIREVGDSGPTIDSITVGEFESQDELKEWIEKHAPTFVRTQ